MLRPYCLLFVLASLLAVPPAGAQAPSTTPDVGSGAPNDFTLWAFNSAFSRNGFFQLVTLPPPADMQRLGTNGVIQLFQDKAKTANVRYAIIKADVNQLYVIVNGNVVGGDAYGVLPTMWAYVASVNGQSVTGPSALNTTGYPTMDTAACDPVGDITCLYQTFDKKYVLFVYSHYLTPNFGGNFALRDPFYTRWFALGGLGGLGAAFSPEQALTSPVTKYAATLQQYAHGALFNVTSGLQSGQLISVQQPFYDSYLANGGPSGTLGFPIAEARSTPDGHLRQTFEGGTLDITPGNDPALLLPVGDIQFSPSAGPIRLRLGDTYTLTARLITATGIVLTDRVVNWASSNARVVAIDAKGAVATLRATGGGSATVTAVSEGKTSLSVTVYVTAPCCQVGEGAPNATVSQAIQDAIKRNRLNVKLPTLGAVRRVGAGYVQEFQDASTGEPYLIADPGGQATAYLVRGDVLARYYSLGGPAGPLGYPAMDATATGRQLFAARAALAGSPVRLVQYPILDRWAAAGYEAGALGPPLAEAVPFFTFTGTAGFSQPFAGGVIYSTTAGVNAGQQHAVGGVLLAKFLSLGGVTGQLGAPLSEEVIIDGRRRQQFEGGLMQLAAGATDPDVQASDRQPRINATPDPVTAGSRVRLSAGGFANGARLRVSVTGQPDFLATASNGAFAWDLSVASTASSGAVQVKAVADDGSTAGGSFRIRSLVDADPRLTKVSGDLQTGAAGSQLPASLRVALRDSSGNPIARVPVVFQASPGGAIVKADALTDSRGEAAAVVRLPASDSIGLFTATAARLVVTFSAKASTFQLNNFPRLRQNPWSVPLGNGTASISDRGALLASVANIVRYHQDRGELPSPNGPADILGLNSFLKSYCTPVAGAAPDAPPLCDGFLAPANTDEQVANLWRVPAFVGGGAAWQSAVPSLTTVRDWLLDGSPVLVALAMTADGAPAGMHYVVATGVESNAWVSIFDPADLFGRAALNQFLDDFNFGGHVWRGSVISILRLVPQAPSPLAFATSSALPVEIVSAAGACGISLDWLDRSVTLNPAQQPGPFRQAWCDGLASQYQMNVAAAAGGAVQLTSLSSPAFVQALAVPGSGAWRLTGGPAWTAAPQLLELDLNALAVNAADQGPELAPGSLMAVFGTGFLGPDASLSIDIDGQAVDPYLPSAFRINVPIPTDLSPGPHMVRIASPQGAVGFPVDLLPAAPAVFQSLDGRPVLLNADGQQNSADQPARRGAAITALATGLGVMDGLNPSESLSAFVAGAEVPVTVTAASGIPDAWQLRLVVPPATAPGPAVPLVFQQGGRQSRPVGIVLE